MSDEWRVRASPGAKLNLLDPDCLRRQCIAALLERKPAAQAALDALGGKEFLPPPISIDVIRRLHDRVLRGQVNELAGMTSMGFVEKAGLSRSVAEHDRIIIWWLLHDLYCRAKVAPERIKAELRLRANAERKAGELAQIGRGDLATHVALAIAAADKHEPYVGRKDPMRPPISVSDAEALQPWARQFLPEATPTWNSFLGVVWRPGDRIDDTFGAPAEFGAPAAVGRDSALGALAVIIPALVRRRGCDSLIASLAWAVFGVEVTRKDVVYRRKVFLTQRGFQSSATVYKTPTNPTFCSTVGGPGRL